MASSTSRKARQPRPETKKKIASAPRWRFWLKRISLFTLLGISLFATVAFLYFAVSVYRLRALDPQTSALRERREAQGIATRGFLFVPLSEISPNLIKAVIAGEDQLFWEHNGFDTEALRKAALKNLLEGAVIRGGSTITQQLAKNLYLSEEKSFLRKGKEALLAALLEALLSKERILELYLNLIEWGEGIYGAEAASQFYFHRSAAKLSKDEAAHLAAMIPNRRTVYNPVENPERHRKHKRFILKWMDSVSAKPKEEKK